MKLRTSFFNGRVLRKNLSRFAPLWVLYAVAEVLGLLSMNINNDIYYLADDLATIMGPVSIFHAVYALIVAACLFGDLFDSRLCNGLHAMPMRREGWLITNLVSGLIFGLIPALVGGSVGATVLGKYYWIALLWQAASLLQYVFFFGLAVFSAMCAGKRLGMIAMYAIVNFLSLLIYWVATVIYTPLLPGVVLADDWFRLFCPITSMASNAYVDFYYDKILGGFFNGIIQESWHYLYICAGVGLVFMLLSWLVYRKRHLETAGDFISFRPMRIFFLLGYTFALGAFLYMAGELFGTYRDYGFLVVGLLIGWFTGWMLLERTAKIFTKKVLFGFAAFALLFAGSIGVTMADPLGVVTYAPRSETVEYACLYPMNERYYYYAQEGYEGRHITDTAELETVRQLHQQMIVTPEEPDAPTVNMEVRYQLKNGKHICRRYNVPAQSQTGEDLKGFLSDMRSVFVTEDTQQIWECVNYAHIYLQTDDNGQKDIEIRDREQLEALLTAMEADCRAGTFAQHDYFHTDYQYLAGLDVTWRVAADTGKAPTTRNKHMMIYSDCQNIAAFLETLDKN